MLLANSIKNSRKNLYLHPKPFKINFKSNSYLMLISRRGRVNSSTLTFPNINLTKAMTNVLILWKSLKKGCTNLYFHSFTFNMSYEPFAFLTALSRGDHVKSSTTTFGNINLTKTVIDLNVDWKSVKKGCMNLYLCPKSFKFTFKPNSYLICCINLRSWPSKYVYPHFLQYLCGKNNSLLMLSKRATSITWTRILDLDPKNLDPENLDLEKPGP